MSEKLNESAAQAARERFEDWKRTFNYDVQDQFHHHLLSRDEVAFQAFCAGMRVIEESRQPETQKLGYCDSPHNLDESMKQRSHQHNGLTCRYWHGQVEESRQPGLCEKNSPYHDPRRAYCLDCLPPDAPLGTLLVGTREPTAGEIKRGLELEPLAQECLAKNATREVEESRQPSPERIEDFLLKVLNNGANRVYMERVAKELLTESGCTLRKGAQWTIER